MRRDGTVHVRSWWNCARTHEHHAGRLPTTARALVHTAVGADHPGVEGMAAGRFLAADRRRQTARRAAVASASSASQASRSPRRRRRSAPAHAPPPGDRLARRLPPDPASTGSPEDLEAGLGPHLGRVDRMLLDIVERRGGAGPPLVIGAKAPRACVIPGSTWLMRAFHSAAAARYSACWSSSVSGAAARTTSTSEVMPSTGSRICWPRPAEGDNVDRRRLVLLGSG
jgi:hypothetical protein